MDLFGDLPEPTPPAVAAVGEWRVPFGGGAGLSLQGTGELGQLLSLPGAALGLFVLGCRLHVCAEEAFTRSRPLPKEVGKALGPQEACDVLSTEL